MKRIITVIILSFFVAIVWAQSPEKMSYQAVIRNSSNQLVINQAVGMKINVLQASATGISVYSETHQAATNGNGLVSIQIGAGQTSDDFSSIDWSKGPYFLKTEIDPSGGTNYSIVGTTQLLSVPFSLYSTTAENVIYERQTLGDVLDNMNKAYGQIKEVSEPTDPKDAVNKEYVTLGISRTGDTLFLGKNQSLIIRGISSDNVKAPTVKTMKANNTSSTTSILAGNIADNGWNEIKEYGFEYSKTPEFEIGTGTKVTITAPITKGDFSAEIANLAEDEMYYFKAFAKNDIGITYGEEESFNTFRLLNSSPSDAAKISSVIGSGYDLVDKYANSFSIKSKVLDFDKMHDAKLIVIDENQNFGEILSASGAVATEYQSSMSAFANIKASYGGFKGEINGRFEGNKTSSSNYSFGTATSRQVKTAYHIKREYLYNLTLLYPYITAAFEDDMMKLDTADIWSRYGTDVLLGGLWGGRADYNMYAKRTGTSDGKDIGAYASARYESLFVSGSGSAGVDEKYKNNYESSSVYGKITARGGLSALIAGPEDFKAWAGSINDENEVFMEYYPGTVIPIYEFIKDPSRREEIKTLREVHLKKSVIPVVSANIPFPVEKFPLNSQGFTKLVNGDAEMNSKSGRNTFVNVTVTVQKHSSTVIRCTINLTVQEEYPDNTKYAGTTIFDISSEWELIDFKPLTYTSSKIQIEGRQHDYVGLSQYVTVGWLKGLKVRFDSNNSNDQSSIGIKGELTHIFQTRSPLE